MSDALADFLFPEDTAATEDAPAEDAPAEDTAAAEDAPAEDAPTADTPVEEWTEERIAAQTEWTPEQAQAAGSYLQERQRKLERHWGASERKRQTSERQLAEAKQLQEQLSPAMQALQTLRSGDVDARLSAIASLTGMPAAAAIEMLTLGVTDEHQADATPEAQLRKELEQLRQEREQEREQREREQQRATNEAAVKGELQRLVADANAYPAIARAAAANQSGAAKQIFDYMLAQAQSGINLTTAQACAIIEVSQTKAEANAAKSAVTAKAAGKEAAKSPRPAGGPAKRTARATTTEIKNDQGPVSEEQQLANLTAFLEQLE